MEMRIPPLKNNIMLESNPLKSIMLVPRLAVTHNIHAHMQHNKEYEHDRTDVYVRSICKQRNRKLKEPLSLNLRELPHGAYVLCIIKLVTIHSICDH